MSDSPPRRDRPATSGPRWLAVVLVLWTLAVFIDYYATILRHPFVQERLSAWKAR